MSFENFIARLALNLLKRKDIRQGLQQALPVSAPLTTPAPIKKHPILSEECQLLLWIKEDNALSDMILGHEKSEERQLVQLIARVSQWNTVEELHECFSERCKQEKRAVSNRELDILNRFLAIHNLIWNDKEATLTYAEQYTRYEHREHERGTLTGDVIQETWLPGLRNAGGILTRKPLVRTESLMA